MTLADTVTTHGYHNMVGLEVCMIAVGMLSVHASAFNESSMRELRVVDLLQLHSDAIPNADTSNTSIDTHL